MESTQPGVSFYVDTPLKAKISKASKSVPKHVQWRLYTAGLVLVDTLMIGIAFRFAYFLRFQLGIDFFFQNYIPVQRLNSVHADNSGMQTLFFQ